MGWRHRISSMPRSGTSCARMSGRVGSPHGLLLLACCVGTIIAPPFSGLDTLPALGGVAIALSIILEDIIIFAIGTGIGAGGLALIVTLGAAAAKFVKELF